MSLEQDEPLDVEELDVEEGEDLEAAMREALEAVESSAAVAEQPESEGTDVGGPDAATAPDSGTDTDVGANEVATMRKELAELRDRSVRTLADFDNFRKRAERERLEQQRYAGTEVLRDLLDVVDNLERALEANGEFEDLKAGVELIVRQIFDLLRRHGVSRVDTAGRAFDPSLHEAVSRQEDPDAKVPIVHEELQAGYVMKDRLLRPSMVVVAVPPSQAVEPENAD